MEFISSILEWFKYYSYSFLQPVVSYDENSSLICVRELRCLFKSSFIIILFLLPRNISLFPFSHIEKLSKGENSKPSARAKGASDVKTDAKVNYPWCNGEIRGLN